MMKRRNLLLRIILLLALVVCIAVNAAHVVYGAGQRVFDEASLFTDAGRENMEERIQTLRKQMSMDVVIVTTTDSGGKSSTEYADDYYDYGGFGNGEKASGVLFLIDMDNREIYISTTGTMSRFLTDERIESMLDREYDYIAAEEYGAAAQVFLDDVENYYKKGIPGGQYNYDSETGEISEYHSIKVYEGLLALAVAGICAGGACYGVLQEYAMKKERRQSVNYLKAYRSDCNFALTVQNDAFLDKSVSRTVIARTGGGGSSSGRSSSGRSTTHRSSSGRSHGGGGRKF